MPRTLLKVAAAIAFVGVAVGPVAQGTLGLLGDQASSTGAFTTDTLNPPTGLAATGGLNASLTWTPTVDTYATGYFVYRTLTSGSGYAQVGNVTPRTAAATTDSPGASGLYYYVLRSYFQSWTSVQTAELSALVLLAALTTPYGACTAGTSAPEAGWGDGNGYETTPNNACVSGAGVATDANSGSAGNSLVCTNLANDAHRFRDFTIGVPGTAFSIDGIEVRADVGMNNNGGTSAVCIQLSWDGGTNWTTAKSATLAGTAISQYLLGGLADTWGRTWTAAELSNANFRVRVIDATTQSNKDFRLDYLAVRVQYTP